MIATRMRFLHVLAGILVGRSCGAGGRAVEGLNCVALAVREASGYTLSNPGDRRHDNRTDSRHPPGRAGGTHPAEPSEGAECARPADAAQLRGDSGTLAR